MFRRVLLKLSGEVLSGEGKNGFSRDMAEYLIEEIRPVVEAGIELGIVVGAGNIFRGKELQGIRPAVADEIGMMGTLINSIYIKEVFEGSGIKTTSVSSVANLPSLSPHKYDIIRDSLKKGNVVVFGGGTTQPFFTTDTASAIRAIEMEADVMVKATKVDGVYDKDPKKHEDAMKIDRISFKTAMEKDLKVMDNEAFSLCKRYELPVIVIDFFTKGNLLSAIMGEKIGTLVIPD